MKSRNPIRNFCVGVLFGALGGIAASILRRFTFEKGSPDLAAQLLPPDSTHWLGTDQLGREVFARVMDGAVVSVQVALFAAVISLAIGLLVGIVAGSCGRWIDCALMRVVDAVRCFPAFLLALTVVALLGPSLPTIVLVIGLVSCTSTARIVRSGMFDQKGAGYVQAARAIGVSKVRIVFLHLVPNAVPSAIAAGLTTIPVAILIEAGLGFLGLGVPSSHATLGAMIADSLPYALDAWWVLVFPGLALLVLTFPFFLIGEKHLRPSAKLKESTAGD